MKPLIFLALLTIILVFLNLFPNYYAFINTPKDYVFSGQASWFDPWDINAYVSAIKFGQSSKVLLENVYTSEQNNGVLIYFVYTIFGAAFQNFNPFLIFYILSIIGTMLLTVIVFKCSQVFISWPNNYLASALIVLGGGLGWLFYPNITSSDVFITGFTFVSHFQRFHEALAISFYLLSLILFWHKNYFFSSLCLILTLIFYPYYLLSYILISLIFINIIYFKEGKVDFIRPLFIIFFPAICFNLLYLFHLQSNPTFSSVLSQNLSTPNMLDLMLGYGILAPLFLLQLIWGKRDEKYLFLNTWFIVSLLLSFLPFGFSRFYLRLLFFPLIILIFLNIKNISARILLPSKIVVLILFILLPISTIFIFNKRVNEINNNNPWYYLSKEKFSALENLKNLNKYPILATYNNGNIIPAFTGQKVYLGHMIQTPNAEEKLNNLGLFYSNSFDDLQAKEFLDTNHISYIFYGPEEKQITLDYSKLDKLKYSFLKEIFRNNEVVVFQKN